MCQTQQDNSWTYLRKVFLFIIIFITDAKAGESKNKDSPPPPGHNNVNDI